MRLCWGGWLLGVLTLVCCTKVQELAWQVDTTSLPLPAARIDVTIYAGACGEEGAALYQASLASMEQPPQLAPGTYAFELRAYDELCQLVGSGCDELTINDKGEAPAALMQVLLPAAEPALACDVEQVCSGGQCLEPMAVLDAQVDAPVEDAGVMMDVDAGPVSDYDLEQCDDFRLSREYLLCRAPLSFEDAANACAAGGYHLITVGSAQEQSIVMVGVQMLNAELWIGLNDIDSEGDFVWVETNTSAPDFRNWEGANPNGGTSDNCARARPPEGGWADTACATTLAFLCEGNRE